LIGRRASGILLHVSSLPSEFGVGDLGPGAYRWIDFLVEAGQSVWQVLPLNPTTVDGHNSPYQAASGFAGNPLFVSPSLLRKKGLLTDGDLRLAPAFREERVDYGEVYSFKRGLLDLAYDRFVSGARAGGYDNFCARNVSWLNDFALFMAVVKAHRGRRLRDLPAPLRDRTPDGLAEIGREERDEIERQKFFQYLFSEQWRDLKRYANERGVQIVGDLPFYTSGEGADVWASPSLFKLDGSKRPTVVAGVPPDAFSATGQLWGNPVYDWDRHAKSDYAWWIARMRRNLELFDVVRIDHFRGFAASWEVPAGHETAAGGSWVGGPGDAFFKAVLRHWPFPPLVAEDLGMITADVRELMRRYQFPGMKVLLFAFDGDSANPYLPHNHEANAVLYTGTHDNNTIRGWFEDEASQDQKRRLAEYVGAASPNGEVWWELIRLAMMSVCGLVVIPMQDVLGLDSTARMNRPAVAGGTWEWRLTGEGATHDIAAKLSRLAETYGRA
jgi:4-alpha-glucanotransferase